MADNRIIKAKKNIIVSFACQIITILCGFVVPKIMLNAYGSESYGAVASISQFLGYIALLDGGITGVAKSVLYKPLAENDIEKISAIISEIKRFFKIVAYIFIVYVIILACSFKNISDIETLNWISTFILVIVISISTFGQYFIGISNFVLLQASQRSYVYHAINIVTTILNTILVIVFVGLGFNLIIVKLVSSIVFFMRPVMQWAYVKKNFVIKKCRHNKTYLEQKWSGLGQHIAYVLHTSTDVAILTLFTNLNLVAVYSVYNMVVGHIKNLNISFASGMEAVFGDMLAKKEYDKLHRTFGYYETLISTSTMLLFSVTAVLIVPFIKIYTSGVNDADYYAPVFAVLLVIAAVLYCLRLPYNAMVIASGHFKQTSKAAYLEAIINVGVSVLLVNKFGLIGVATGTIIATMFRFVYYVVYFSQNVFYRKIQLFVKRFLVNSLTFISVLMVGKIVLALIDIDTYLHWIFAAVLVGISAVIVIILVNIIFYYSDSKMIVTKFLKKKL